MKYDSKFLHFTESKKEQIDNVLTKLIEKGKTPSVQYTIFKKDSIIHKFQGGYADIINKKPTNENTTYNAYSITKTFTALAILQLVEKQKIDIKQPLSIYLKDFTYSSEITIEQLLNHTSGIPNPIPLSWIHLIEEHKLFDSNDFFKHIFSKNSKLKSKPNEKYSYSNLGYVILGRLIEKVSGIDYEQYIRINILNVLDINKGEIGFTIKNVDNHAKGYHKKYSLSNIILGFMIDKTKFMSDTEEKWNSFNNLYVNGPAYGGLISTSNALVKYIQDILKPNSKLISNDYKKKLFTENFTNNKKPTGMCLSWFTGQLSGNKYFTHAGGGGGYYSEIRIYPDKGIGSVIMFNRTGISDERFLDKLDKYVLNE